jgi:hypothetical protein
MAGVTPAGKVIVFDLNLDAAKAARLDVDPLGGRLWLERKLACGRQSSTRLEASGSKIVKCREGFHLVCGR